MESYSYTGMNLPIDINTTILYVIKQLKEFDDNLEKGILLPKSPYHDIVVMETGNGKLIEIPNEIKQQAIQKWEIIKAETVYEKQKKNIEDKIIQLSNKLNEDTVENFDNYSYNYGYAFAIIIVIIIIIGFTIYQKKLI